MKTKSLCRAAFILLILFTGFLFIPDIYSRQLYVLSGYTFRFELTRSYMESFAETLGGGDFVAVLAVICLASSAVGIVALILKCSNKESSVVNMLCALPVVSAISFITASLFYTDGIYMYNSRDRYLTWNLEWGFFVDAALILAVAVMSIIIVVKKSKSIETYEEQFRNDSDADELS